MAITLGSAAMLMRRVLFSATLLVLVQAAYAQSALPALSNEDEQLVQLHRFLDRGNNPAALDAAYEILEKLLVAHPNSARVHYGYARYHANKGYRSDNDSYAAGALEKALAEAEIAAQLDPTFAPSFIFSGHLNRRLGRVVEAQASLDRARELNPHDGWLHLYQAELYEDQGKLAEAIQFASRSVNQHGPDNGSQWRAYQGLLRLYCKQQDLVAADVIYDEAFKRYPNDAWVPANYAIFLIYNVGEFERAAALARQSLAMHSRPRVERTLGLALYGIWAERVMAGAQGEEETRLFDEADLRFSYSQLLSERDLRDSKLAVIAEALQITGRSLDNHGLFFLLMKHEVQKSPGFRALSKLTVSSMIAPAVVLGLLLCALAHSYQRRAQAAPGVLPAPPLVDQPFSQVPAEKFRFTGSGNEYFRIWIVNLLLTIVTLGIYSAWAKVRRLKYFYRNTELAGARFDYHGKPIGILMGRLIAVIALLAYDHAFGISLDVGIATLAVLAVSLPWLLRNSLRFRLRNASYRGLRFSFDGTPGQAYYVFLFGGLASLASLYLMAPYYHQKLKAYQHGQARFGTQRFYFGPQIPDFKAGAWAFYKVYFSCLGMLLLLFILFSVVTSVLIGAFADSDSGSPASLAIVSVLALYLLIFFAVLPYFLARLHNLIWNNTRLGNHRFYSSLSARKLSYVYFTNLLATLLTLGFYYPWAAVRLAQYRLSAFELIPAESLDGLAADPQQAAQISATGQEVADTFDFDIAL